MTSSSIPTDSLTWCARGHRRPLGRTGVFPGGRDERGSERLKFGNIDPLQHPLLDVAEQGVRGSLR